MKRTILSIIILLTAALLCAQTESKVVVYEDGFEGVTTASGEIFTQEKLTAAHASLPLGTQVEIMNILNEKKVIVTVNDRIQDAPDLFWISRAAAATLEIDATVPTEILYVVQGGLSEAEPTETYLKLFASLGPNLEKPVGDPRVPLSMGDTPKAYGVKIYAASKRIDAVTLSRRIMQELEYISYFEKTKMNDDTIFRVIIGDFATREEALDCYWKLNSDIPDIFLVEIY